MYLLMALTGVQLKAISDPSVNAGPVPVSHKFIVAGAHYIRHRMTSRCNLAVTALVWILVALQVFDTISTVSLIGFHGVAEANPAMAWLLDRSHAAFIAFKLSVAVFSGWCFFKYKELRIFKAGLYFLTTLYLGIAIVHVYIIGKIL